MKKSIVAALFCLSFTANAETLLVEYTGTVSSIERNSSLAEIPPYSIGDSIVGSLIIDTAFAAADEVADDGRVGRYYAGSSGLDFILGAPHPAGRRGPADFVVVYDDWEWPWAEGLPEDGIVINDSSIGSDGDYNFLLGLQRPNLLGQLFSDDALSQSFVVEREAGMNLWGFIESGFGELWNIVTFSLDRLSVKPSLCRA
ncbi:MAG TPA: hypothetical protein VLI71_18850 [Gammaproteobacteria bacterium]|nr:hypothetical protein [Gammaproteobacteria bacterium]